MGLCTVSLVYWSQKKYGRDQDPTLVGVGAVSHTAMWSLLADGHMSPPPSEEMKPPLGVPGWKILPAPVVL